MRGRGLNPCCFPLCPIYENKKADVEASAEADVLMSGMLRENNEGGREYDKGRYFQRIPGSRKDDAD